MLSDKLAKLVNNVSVTQKENFEIENVVLGRLNTLKAINEQL